MARETLTTSLETRTKGGHASRSAVRQATAWAMEHPALAAFVVALLVRLFVILLLNTIIDDSLFALDDGTYQDMATQAATGEVGSWDDYTRGLYNSTLAFTGSLTLLYKALGAHAILGRILVAIAGAITAALVARLAARIMSPAWGLAAGLLIAFLPSQIIWSSLLLKDPFVWPALAGLGLAVVVASETPRPRWLLGLGWAAFLLVVLTYLRNHTLVVAVWALGAAVLVTATRRHLFRAAAGLSVAMIVPLALGLGPGGVSVVTSAGSLEARRLANASGANTAFVEPEPTPTETSEPGIAAAPPRELAAAKEEVESQEAAVASLVSGVEGVRQDFLGTQAQVALAVKTAQDAELAAEAPGLSKKARRAAVRAAARKRAEAIRQRAAAVAKEEKLERLERALVKEQRILEAEAAHLAQLQSQAPTPPTAPPTEASAETLDPDLAHLPKGLFVLLFEPVPWGGGSSSLRLARLEAIVWYPLLLLSVVGLWASRKHLRSMTFPLLAGGGMLFVYALTEGNIGTAYRHRGEFVWVVALLAVLGARAVSDRYIRRDEGV